MQIGEASRASGLPAKTIRYYEDIGLVRPMRHANGYRDYSDADVERLVFVQRARSLGFHIDTCRQLLALYGDAGRASADVKALAEAHLDEIEAKRRELDEMARTLRALIADCRGDAHAACPIIDGLAGKRTAQ